MGLIGSVLGGVTSAVGGIFAGKALNKGYKQQQEIYNNRLNEIRNHMNMKYYQDPTKSADNQAAVTQAQELLGDQIKSANDSAIVSGSTNDSVALQKQAAAATVGNMLQQQAAAGEANRENAYQNAQSQIDAFTNYQATSKLAQAQGKAQAITSAASGLAGAFNNLSFGTSEFNLGKMKGQINW